MVDPALSQVLEPFAEQFRVQMVPASPVHPEPRLFLELAPDEHDRLRRLELTFMAHEDDVFHLQYFAPLPFLCPSGRVGDLARLIAFINLRLPLIGFGLNEGEGWVFFRCVMPCPRRELDPEICIGTAWMAYYIVDQFQRALESIASGTATLAEAVAEAERVLASQPQRSSP